MQGLEIELVLGSFANYHRHVLKLFQFFDLDDVVTGEEVSIVVEQPLVTGRALEEPIVPDMDSTDFTFAGHYSILLIII